MKNPPAEPKRLDVEAEALRISLDAKGILVIALDMPPDNAHGISLQVAPGYEERVPELLRKVANRFDSELAFRKAKGQG